MAWSFKAVFLKPEAAVPRAAIKLKTDSSEIFKNLEGNICYITKIFKKLNMLITEKKNKREV